MTEVDPMRPSWVCVHNNKAIIVRVGQLCPVCDPPARRAARRGGPRPDLLNGDLRSAVHSGELRPTSVKVALLTGPGSYIPDRPPPAGTWVWRETSPGVLVAFPPKGDGA